MKLSACNAILRNSDVKTKWLRFYITFAVPFLAFCLLSAMIYTMFQKPLSQYHAIDIFNIIFYYVCCLGQLLLLFFSYMQLRNLSPKGYTAVIVYLWLSFVFSTYRTIISTIVPTMASPQDIIKLWAQILVFITSLIFFMLHLRYWKKRKHLFRIYSSKELKKLGL